MTAAILSRTFGGLFAVFAITAELSLPAHADETSATIHIQNSAFIPAKITIPAGTTITWINDGEDMGHNVVSTSNAFESKLFGTGQHYSFTFTAPGTYEYFCEVHPYMRGKIIVK
jgi:plastocyanin